MAQKVLAGRTLASLRMEALSGLGRQPRRLDASLIDWPAVASGRQDLRVRELPGPGNSMGRVKFVFPNDEGIYLHDTPDRAPRRRTTGISAMAASGWRMRPSLARWLLQKPLRAASKEPEQGGAAAVPVPVYLDLSDGDGHRCRPRLRDDVV